MKNQFDFWWHFIVASVFLLSCKKEVPPAEKFHGMWRLAQYETRDSISKVWHPDSTRTGLTGFVVYDGLGHMGVQQVKAPDGASDNNLDIAYFAKYTLLEGGVIQHTKVSSSFDDAGNSVRRSYEFRGDTLFLTPEEQAARCGQYG